LLTRYFQYLEYSENIIIEPKPALFEEIGKKEPTWDTDAKPEVWQLLKNCVKVSFRDCINKETIELFQITNWKKSSSNGFFFASDFFHVGEVDASTFDVKIGEPT